MSTLRKTPTFEQWFFGDAFAAHLEAIPADAPPAANPRDGWPDRTDLDTWEVTGEDAWDLHPVTDEPRPEAEPAPFAPSAVELAWDLGFGFGLDRDDVDAPAHLGPEEARAFEAGLADGFREWERRLEEMFGERVAMEASVHADPEYRAWCEEFSRRQLEARIEHDGRVTDSDVHPRGVC